MSEKATARRRPWRVPLAAATILCAAAFAFGAWDGAGVRPASAQTTAPKPPPEAPTSSPATTPAAPAPASKGSAKAPSSGAPNLNPNGLLGFGDQKDGVPVTVEADNGIEWQDKRQVYIARGNAKAVRGDVTVYGQVLTAYYRKTPSGGSDIWRLEADDQVKITTPTDTAVGDHAVYDVDNAIFVLTGKHLQLDTPKTRITAHDSLEYWQKRDYAVARGDAVALRADKTVRANVLVAHFTRNAKGDQEISDIEAFKDVVVSTPSAVARGMYGNYNLNTSIARLIGGVKITRGKDQLDGECADVNLDTGVSRLFSCTNAPVRGLLVPKSGETNPLSGNGPLSGKGIGK
ncbi:MAG TPA: LptA/OstA family protein [Alphaproteobacteria bacterium]|nr:LptA/OstA family protein [Alphaproteobacteria bacterium]